MISAILCLGSLIAQDFQWLSQLSGASEEVATDIVVDANGNTYVCGFFGNTLDHASGTFTSTGFRDGFLAKYDPQGGQVWIEQLGSISDDEGKVLGIDNQNYLYLLINHFDSLTIQGQTIYSPSDWSVIIFDANGVLIRDFDPFVEVPTIFSLTDMAVSDSGTIVLTGDFGLASFNNPTILKIGADILSTHPRTNGQFVRQVWVAAYNSMGQNLWTRVTRSTGVSGATAGQIEMGDNEEVLVSGMFSIDPLQGADMDFGPGTDTLNAGDGSSLFLTRLDLQGDVQWADAISPNANALNPGFLPELRSTALHWGPSGEILIGGQYSGQILFGGDSIATPSGGFLPVSYLFLARYTSDHQQDWILSLENSEFFNNTLSALASDATGHVYVGGTVRDSLIIDQQFLLGSQDAFLISLDSLGHLNWTQTIQGADDLGLEVELNGLHSTDEGVLTLCGSADAPATFGGISMTDSGSSCCSNAYVTLLADSCAAFQAQAGFSYQGDSDPQTILFSSTAIQADSILWDFGDGRLSQQNNPTHRFFIPGPYEVCQTVFNDCGMDMYCETIYVNCQVEADFNYSLDPNNLTVSFTNQSKNASSWAWDFGDGNGDTVANPVHQFPSPDSFEVILIAYGDCGMDTSVQTIQPLCQPTIADFDFIPDSTNLTVTFSNLSSNGQSYFWDFGDGSVSVEEHPQHQFPSANTFEVRLIVTGPCSIDTISQMVTTSCEATTSAFSFIPDPDDLSVVFSNLSMNAQSFAWDFGDGNFSADPNPTHVYSEVNTFTVSLIAFGACGIDTVSQVVQTNCGPTIAAFEQDNDSSNLTTSFLNQSVNARSFFWDFGDGTTSTDTFPVHQYPFPDSFQVILIASGPCEQDTAFGTVEAQCEASVADFSFEIDTTNLEVHFTNLSQNASQFDWQFGDGTVIGDTDPSHQFPAPGDFTVSLIAYGACGADTISKTVSPQCSGTKAAFAYLADSLDMNVQFGNLSINADSYSWDFGDGTGSSESSPSHTYASPDYYEVWLIASGACSIDTVKSIIRPDCNVPQASVTASIDAANFRVILNTTLQGAASLSWNFDGGIGDSLLLNPEIVFPGPGVYSVLLRASNLCGSVTYCTQLVLPSLTMSANSKPSFSVPWRVYPNPANEYWWLEKLEGHSGEVDIQILDVLGRTCFDLQTRMGEGEKLAIPASHLASGRYWLSILGEHGRQTIALQKE